ncbi:unnamed protein product [Paramecium pentaurelia]|uniref:Transmembrane protein n=1 Tax=Paramecium pentaurelia TaxID=43138 RepID=A0A8S1VNR4_9CILI|nr:unnamed protein product [Paramecium pentaurelia]
MPKTLEFKLNQMILKQACKSFKLFQNQDQKLEKIQQNSRSLKVHRNVKYLIIQWIIIYQNNWVLEEMQRIKIEVIKFEYIYFYNFSHYIVIILISESLISITNQFMNPFVTDTLSMVQIKSINFRTIKN